MQGSLEGEVYCFDTSSLIKMNSLPRGIFKSVYGNMAGMVSKGRAIAPEQVFRELMAKEGVENDIMKWAKENRKMFVKPNDRSIEQVRDIMVKFPNFVDIEKETPEADPFLISLALQAKAVVVSEEVETNPRERPRIPNVCKHYGVRHLNFFDFMLEMGWEF